MSRIGAKETYANVNKLLLDSNTLLTSEKREVEEVEDDLFVSERDVTSIDASYLKRTQSLVDEYLSSSLSTKNEQQLNPVTPGVVLQSASEAYSPLLLYFCLSHPISIVRRIDAVLNINLELFTTKSLLETDSTHPIEIRYQRQQATDENWDTHSKRRVWSCESTPSSTSLAVYAQYQAQSFQEAVKEEKISRLIIINN